MKLKAVSLIDKAINELKWVYKTSSYTAKNEIPCQYRDIAIHQRDTSQWLLQELKLMKRGIISAYNTYGVVTSPKKLKCGLQLIFLL